MSSGNNPPSPWVFDYTNEQYVRWDHQRRCWVDERNRETGPPQASPPTAAGPPPGQRTTGYGQASRSAVPPAYGGASATASLEQSMRQMSVGTSSTPRPSVVPAYRATATDTRTGAETFWDITETRQYRDPRTSESTRSLNVKRIRQPDPKKGARSITGFQVSQDPARDYRAGRVIEVALVPPNPNTATSTLSQITPSPDLPQGKGTRYRRFVISRYMPDGRKSFEALAIKTYNGLGVAAPGVIKSHHTVIYTNSPPPAPSNEELAIRRPNGQLEGSMQAMAIKVEQFDRAKKLDPKARLDYMDTYEFDFGVNNIKLWGRIAPESEPSFFSQYNHVWQMVFGAAAGPGQVNYGGGGDGLADSGQLGIGASSSSATSTTGTVTGPSYGSYQAQPQAPPRTGYALPPTATNPRANPGPSRTMPTATTAQAGVISDDDMWALVRQAQDHARRHRLTVPGQTLTAAQIRTLATNAQARATFFQKIRDAWRDEEEEEDDSDDD